MPFNKSGIVSVTIPALNRQRDGKRQKMMRQWLGRGPEARERSSFRRVLGNAIYSPE